MARDPSQGGSWATLHVEADFSWPENEQSIAFRGIRLWLLPYTDDYMAMVAIECGEHGISSDVGYRLLRQFVSALVWSKGKCVKIHGAGGGTYAYRMRIPYQRNPIGTVGGVPHFDYLPEPESARSLLGLALYREAIEADNVAFRVLGFSKIFNVLHKSSREQKDWINSQLEEIQKGRDRLQELQNENLDVGQYIYESCRCAVAHAFSEPLINPDEPADYKRLSRDLDLVKELAEIAIEYELGVKSSMTIYREHLYELEGFRNLFGPELVNLLKGPNLAEQAGFDFPEFPRITIRLRDVDAFDALTAMEVTDLEVREDGIVRIRCDSDDRTCAVYLYLHFPEERLLIDIEAGFAVFDAGTPQAARYAADVCGFKAKYFLNGELEIWDAENGILLGRCDPFLPTNVLPVETAQNFEEHAIRFLELARSRTDEGD